MTQAKIRAWQLIYSSGLISTPINRRCCSEL
jgi:hypothetical protein